VSHINRIKIRLYSCTAVSPQIQVYAT